MAKTITNVMEWAGLRRKQPAPELSRSQYSLVSCGDLSPAAVELWLGLPEEVKYDPALAPFRRYYEKDKASKHEPTRKTSQIHMKHPRLPSVNSAPLLNNNEHKLLGKPNGGATDTGKDLEIPKWKEPIPENEPEPTPRMSKVARARLYIKLSLMLAIWVFFTIVFMMYNEKEEPNRQSSLAPGKTKDYTLNYSAPDFTVLVKVTGPFFSDQKESGMSSAQKDAEQQKMYLWLERRALDGSTVVSTQASKPWSVILEKDKDLDFAVGETRSQLLRVEEQPPSTSAGSTVYVIRMNTTTSSTVPLSMSYFANPLDQKTGVIISFILLVGLYALIISEVINRTMAALVTSTSSLAVLALVGERPSLEELVSWLDTETLLLLFSMMLLVAIMAETGMFDYLAVFTFQILVSKQWVVHGIRLEDTAILTFWKTPREKSMVTKGKLWPLINLLCAITAICSTVLDNVTTVLLMTPVTIRLCEVTELDPIPILIAMVLYCNIGGAATPVGDPPNAIIASNKMVVDSGINFTNFTLHMTLGSLLVCVQTYFQLKYIYRDTDKLRLSVPKEIQELRQQIAIWRRASESLPHMSKDEQVVREQLDRKVKKLNSQLEVKIQESTKCACPKEDFDKMLDEMKAKYKIRDKTLLIKALVAVGFAVTLFFLHSIPELKRVSLGWTALLGALLLLILADREDLEPILHRVEWSTLLFFAALFVLMEALSKLGLIAFIGGLTESLILSVHESGRLAVALLLMLWISGITSAFVDNIPLTTMMIRIVTSLGTNPNLGLPMAPLVWALSFGGCMGGNGTLIGASANVVCAGVAGQHGYRISFMRFFKVGFPIMIGHLIVVSCYLLLFHCVIEWH